MLRHTQLLLLAAVTIVVAACATAPRTRDAQILAPLQDSCLLAPCGRGSLRREVTFPSAGAGLILGAMSLTLDTLPPAFPAPRSWKLAMWRGMRGACPHCDEAVTVAELTGLEVGP